MSAASFADEATGRGWVEQRHLVALTLDDPGDSFVEVDLITDSPIPFAEFVRDSVVLRIRGGGVRIASVGHLTAMR
ncbi:MAG: hypothetical protein ACRCY9_18665 [Phycicoccus sp.]